jgi:hypothetical protein
MEEPGIKDSGQSEAGWWSPRVSPTGSWAHDPLGIFSSTLLGLAPILWLY